MKNIKELGLETIQLENQVLLVEKSVISVGDYITDSLRVWRWNDDCSLLGRKKVISSTKPLEGLPLLVIEEEVHELSKEYLKDTTYEKESDDQFIGRYSGFMSGYNKAKETYKFTEEDLRKAIDMARETLEYDEIYGWFTTKSEEEIIQSLTKKELWVEVETELDAYYRNGIGGGGRFPKIIKNTIKAVWK